MIANDYTGAPMRIVVGRQDGYDDGPTARLARDSITPQSRNALVVREVDETELMTLAERVEHRRKKREAEALRREVSHLGPDGRIVMDGLRSLPHDRLYRSSNGSADYVVVPAERVELRRKLREEEARRRELSTYNAETGRVVNVQIPQRSTPKVFVSSLFNHYVIVPARELSESDWDRRNRVSRTEDGTEVVLFSVNGHGEVRWSATPDSLATPSDQEAIDYFRLFPVK